MCSGRERPGRQRALHLGPPSHRTIPPEAWEALDSQVHAAYEQMATITTVPTWARLIDFQTTTPRVVEELARQRNPAR